MLDRVDALGVNDLFNVIPITLGNRLLSGRAVGAFQEGGAEDGVELRCVLESCRDREELLRGRPFGGGNGISLRSRRGPLFLFVVHRGHRSPPAFAPVAPAPAAKMNSLRIEWYASSDGIETHSSGPW